jgi:hypothetical protein
MTQKKFCQTCRKAKRTGWTCRGCGAQVCAHFCGNKVGTQATCGKCRMTRAST